MQSKFWMFGLASAVLALPLMTGSALADRGDQGRGNSGARYSHRDVRHSHHRDHGREKSRFDFSLVFDFGSRVISRPAPVYVYPAPAPVIVAPVRHGYYETRWVPPVYRTHCDVFGRPYTVLVSEGYYQRVWVSGY